MVTEEVTSLIAISTEGAEITEEKIHPLPDIIQTWLRKSNVVGTRLPKSIHISQEGVMRTTAESKWLPFDAEQFFTIDPPGFIWTATIRPNKFFFIVGRDKYPNGEGNMLIKAASLAS